jgi:hypothetical protein
MKYKITVLLIIFLALPFFVSAHSGRTDSSGGHNCRTGSCAGSYHYHNGGYTPPTNSYSSYTPSTYYPVTTPTYVAPTYATNSSCPSYGFAYLGDCYEIPDNARKNYTGFSCNSGYEEVGYGLSKKCLPEIDNGYRIGTTGYCDFGYEPKNNRCVKESSPEYYSSISSIDSIYSGKYNFECDEDEFAEENRCYDLPKNSEQGIYIGYVCSDGFKKEGLGNKSKCIKEEQEVTLKKPISEMSLQELVDLLAYLQAELAKQQG